MFQTTNQYLISTCVVVSDFVSKFRAFQFLRIVALSRRRELKLFPTQSLIQYVPWSQTNPWQREQWDLNLVEISVEQLQMAIHCWKCWFHHHNAGETELAEGGHLQEPHTYYGAFVPWINPLKKRRKRLFQTPHDVGCFVLKSRFYQFFSTKRCQKHVFFFKCMFLPRSRQVSHHPFQGLPWGKLR